MFGFFKEAGKRAKYELHARDVVYARYGVDVEVVGTVRLAKLTDEILETMKKQGLDGEKAYVELLVARLKTMGYIT